MGYNNMKDPSIEYLVDVIGMSLDDIQTTTDVLGFTAESQVWMASEAISKNGLTAQ